MDTLGYLFQSLRPKHWVKNLLVFAPLIFAKQLLNPEALVIAVQTFFLFSLQASAIYLINDFIDYDLDKLHPIKKLRPIASGKLNRQFALIFAFFLSLISFALSILITKTLFFVLFVYFLINLAYSSILKRIFLVDVMLVSSGYLLRVTAGAVVIGVPPSFWLLLCTFFLSLFLVLGKRRAELLAISNNSNMYSLGTPNYSSQVLDQLLILVTVCLVISYFLYIPFSPTGGGLSHPYLVLTVPFTLFGILRYLFLIYKKNSGQDPTSILLSDAPLFLSVFFWILLVIGIIYLV